MFVEKSLVTDGQAPQQSNERKRSLGAFYTPPDLSRILCEWAIRSVDDVVLEPSFGGCNFLEEIASRFDLLGADNPLSSVFGCDIDVHAFDKLRLLRCGFNSCNFLLKDFLLIESSEFCLGGVDAVIGNPPYIGHAQIGGAQKKALSGWREKRMMPVDAKSSLWVYFILHAFEFMRDGGRLAFVLPGSFLSSDYAKKIHALIESCFDRSLIVSLAERIFLDEGAEERTVVLLAEGFRKSRSALGDMRFAHSATLLDVQPIIKRWESSSENIGLFESFGIGSFVARDNASGFIAACEFLPAVAIKNIATVGIGIVTGDTKFFIRKRSDWRVFGVDRNYLKFVVPKIKEIDGINLTRTQVVRLAREDRRCLLLDTRKKKLSPEVVRYLSSYPESQKEIPTYKKRSVWHQPDDGKIPDGFFSFLTHNGPRLIINSAGVNCTNSVYRVFFLKRLSEVESRFLALSMLSSFTQLHAEIIGRPCGSGALKLEPKDVMELMVLRPDKIDEQAVLEVFERVNQALCQNKHDDDFVRSIVDDFLISEIGPSLGDHLETFKRSLIQARSYRKGQVIDRG
ncbi:class I SAM-dependent DNA methyltransferase [Pseudomonas aeruginosa]|uniref:HsdM family class I SAM-dependent methyltransferase n=1 Tax=Pseudomonas aeruginosa TaxID=287 RepID=UPI000F81E93C|nr:N-6 DNA methylase [Pseudomonas aeruginosa]MBW8455511.1 SAM-dependent methyltransferase [Pseudomonas sp.]MBH4102394.1 N-6 DNA methylase [Pseudomonas aeruginosa]RTV59315.1 hypothetical protein DY992_03530 [Pseudomonas aeruginosa]HCF3907970.1 N-6 DNA methylase [Pseudomonas aeruginosa]HEJ2731286.1 N-6 DNA methylase [Pseudomonas aeruginosa]